MKPVANQIDVCRVYLKWECEEEARVTRECQDEIDKLVIQGYSMMKRNNRDVRIFDDENGEYILFCKENPNEK